MFTEEIASLFSENGALARHIKGYRPREGQQILAKAVAQNLMSGGVLLAEAGTGTGKTFAYLLPALAWGKKTLISTASKNLQEQIYQQDLPRMRKVLRSGATVGILKGRRNYLCQQRYEQFITQPALTGMEDDWRAALADFYLTTTDGDLAMLEDVPENAPIMQKITSTAENCLGKSCSFFDECFVQKARQKAKSADVVIVNHHLLLADLTLKTEGFAEILPNIDAFIIDEAHHLPNMALQFFGERFTTRQLLNFLEDCAEAIGEEAPDLGEIVRFLAVLEGQNDTIADTLPERTEPIEEQKLRENTQFWQECDKLVALLKVLVKQLEEHKERGPLLTKIIERCQKLQITLQKFIPQHQIIHEDHIPRAMWLEKTTPRHFMLSSVPINASGKFSQWVEKGEASWTFLSATLAVNGSFGHFSRELGLSDYESLLLPGAFDYPRQAVLYCPPNMPDPKAPTYTQSMIEAILPVLERSHGRAFLLFTSYRALNEAREALASEDFSLLVQGEMPKAQLLQEFRCKKRAVLLATASFWEGVDVRGDKLVCVIIDKLPFTAPNDPVTKARHRFLQSQGLSPFIYDSLPQAIITLKQGVGRLIRDVDDYGVLVIADPRLTQKNYGKDFLRSLPAMSKTRKMDVIDRFFTFHEGKE